jgi:D-sedoheptulose 7-phosphate isomerase
MINPVDIASQLEEHRQVIASLTQSVPRLQQIAEKLTDCLKQGGTIFWMGNGGSAADAQHMAAELVVRFTRERHGLAAIALTTDTSILTAAANDYGYETIFARQLDALCRPGDAVVGLSTSGTSPNVVAGVKTAKKIGAYTLALTGKDGGKLKETADDCLAVASTITARIQEAHGLIGHILCDWLEAALTENERV